jgi:tetratricopeptide (TPR) repeat protein
VSIGRSLIGLVLLVFATPSLADADLTSLVTAGIEAYTGALNTKARDRRLAEFQRAERFFARAVESGVHNPELYTNLGNAALQGERLGSAVLAYRRALRIDPDHARALQNLAYARSLLADWVPHPQSAGFLDSFFFWHRSLSRAERFRVAAFAFAAAALGLALAIRSGQAAWRNAALLPGLVWLAFLASLALDPLARADNEAVITATEAVGRAADSALAPSLFPAPLPSGVEVESIEPRSPWLRIRLANGREAWVGESSVTRVATDG